MAVGRRIPSQEWNDLPQSAKDSIREVFRHLGGFAKHGTAWAMYYRPNDNQLERFRDLEIPAYDEDCFTGRNLYLLYAESEDLNDLIQLSAELERGMDPDARVAWHSQFAPGADSEYRERSPRWHG